MGKKESGRRRFIHRLANAAALGGLASIVLGQVQEPKQELLPRVYANSGDTFLLDTLNTGANTTLLQSNVAGAAALEADNALSQNFSAGVKGMATVGSGLTIGVYGISNSTNGEGINGWATASGGTAIGVYGQSDASSGYGVNGYATAKSGASVGVYGQSDSNTGHGVEGFVTTTSGSAIGVRGGSPSSAGRGVEGLATAASGSTVGVYGSSSSSAGHGVEGRALASSGSTVGVYGRSSSADGHGVEGYASASSGFAIGVYGASSSSNGWGVEGVAMASSGSAAGVAGFSSSPAGQGLRGVATASSGLTYGVWGETQSVGGIGSLGYANASGAVGVLAIGARPDTIPLVAIGASGQTTNLQQWQRSTNSLTLSAVNASGSLGVGTGSPSYALDVQTSGASSSQTHITSTGTDSGGYLTSANPGNLFMSAGAAWNGSAWVAKSSTAYQYGGGVAGVRFFFDTGLTVGGTYTPTTRMFIGPTGNVGIGMSTQPGHLLQLGLDDAAKPSTNTWTIASDGRLKDPESIEPFTEGSELIKRLPQPVWFRYRKESGLPSDRRVAGWVAQDIATVAPFMVRRTKQKLSVNDTDETETLSLNTNELPYALVNSVKELLDDREHMKKQIRKLQGENRRKDREIMKLREENHREIEGLHARMRKLERGERSRLVTALPA